MNKTMLITGSSSGIGRATTEHFARAGWNVAATMRRLLGHRPFMAIVRGQVFK